MNMKDKLDQEGRRARRHAQLVNVAARAWQDADTSAAPPFDQPGEDGTIIDLRTVTAMRSLRRRAEAMRQDAANLDAAADFLGRLHQDDSPAPRLSPTVDAEAEGGRPPYRFSTDHQGPPADAPPAPEQEPEEDAPEADGYEDPMPPDMPVVDPHAHR